MFLYRRPGQGSELLWCNVSAESCGKGWLLHKYLEGEGGTMQNPPQQDSDKHQSLTTGTCTDGNSSILTLTHSNDFSDCIPIDLRSFLWSVIGWLGCALYNSRYIFSILSFGVFCLRSYSWVIWCRSVCFEYFSSILLLQGSQNDPSSSAGVWS